MLKRINTTLLVALILLLAGCATQLVKAAFDGDTNKARNLLDQGANVNEGTFGITPLMEAARRGKIDMVELLLDRGADINYKDYRGTTALFFAVDNEHTDIIQLLLGRGADVDRQSLIAAENSNNSQIALLLKAAQAKKINKMTAIGIPAINTDNALLIAVIDFEAKGVSRQDAMSLSEWLRTELINTNQFKVIERSAMNAILKEQAFTMTGCTDTSCAVQVGKMLSARKMLVGSVELWNNKVFINGRIIDVEKGVAEFAHKETVSSLKELDTGATSFAKNLARRINGLPVE